MADIKTGLLYLGNYKREEEAFFDAAGIRVYRAETWPAANKLPVLEDGVTVLVARGERTTAERYESLWRLAKAGGVSLVTSPQAFRILGNPELQYKALASVSPATIFVNAHLEDFEITNSILRSPIEFPVFIRSDVESAAKYVGFEGCIAQKREPSAIRTVLSNLRRHVRGISQIIAKQVVPIAQAESGKRLEYRAIGARGKFSHFDLAEVAVQPLAEFALDRFADEAFRLLANAGADGAAFIDVAVKASAAGCIVVECKDMLNGSITNLSALAEAVRMRRL